MAKVKALQTESILTVANKRRQGVSGDLFNKQWYLHSTKSPGNKAGAGINVPEAWKITRGAPDIVVAVLDIAFDLQHPAFKRAGKIVSHWC